MTAGALAALAAFPAEAALFFASRDLGADAELARLRPPDEFELGEAPIIIGVAVRELEKIMCVSVGAVTNNYSSNVRPDPDPDSVFSRRLRLFLF